MPHITPIPINYFGIRFHTIPYHIPYQDVKVNRKDTNFQIYMGFNLSARSAGIEHLRLNTKF